MECIEVLQQAIADAITADMQDIIDQVANALSRLEGAEAVGETTTIKKREAEWEAKNCAIFLKLSLTLNFTLTRTRGTVRGEGQIHPRD